MKNSSLAEEQIYLVKGANRILNDMTKAFDFSSYTYNKECASGFYMIKDEDIAETYAIEIAKQGKTEEDRHAYVNYYILNLAEIKKDLKQAYFNRLDKESIHYVGENILGVFPKHCEYYGKSNLSPMDTCHICENEMCNRNADYIEAILSYNGKGKTLDDILKSVVTGDISEEDAIEQINEKLSEWDSPIRIQIVLRKNAKDYIKYGHTREVIYE